MSDLVTANNPLGGIATAPPAAETSRVRPTPHLTYLDGLRGIAALYVLFHHVWVETITRPDASPILLKSICFNWLTWGHYAVDIFIVLSGYCLMLPVAKSDGGRLRGGVTDYLKRRARRILPPYYMALCFSLVLIAAVPGLQHGIGTNWDLSLPAFSSGTIVTHLLLVHNLSQKWIGGIDPPLWSVATEWQIYFLFPALLLPVRTRYGRLATVLIGLLIGDALFLMHFKGACFWFLGLFAMGMAAAAQNFTACGLRKWTARLPWGGLSGTLWLSILTASAAKPGWVFYHPVIVDPFVGAATACLLVYCTECIKGGRDKHPVILRLLDAKVAVALGGFSYSLYLVHYPILAAMHLFLLRHSIGSFTSFWVLAVLGAPAILLISYGFHLLFERPFMKTGTGPRDNAGGLSQKRGG